MIWFADMVSNKKLNLTDKINIRRSDRCVALSNLSIYYASKNI